MNIFVPELIRKKRDGKRLSNSEIKALVQGYKNGRIPDYQMSALLMAVFFKGLDKEELYAWTDTMIHSGEVMRYPAGGAKKVDKHSTGGVGDKISICLAPAVAANGVMVPMISGRGLGHTGGTLDKLESIPGFKTDISIKQAKKQLEKLGLFLIGQTDTLAPADKALYALRDVTATVESIDLICASIMSKKLAEGIDAMVLDLKVGCGAFMKDVKSAKRLGETICQIGKTAGKEVDVLMTDMNAPIGTSVGNSLEVKEAIEVMRGKGPFDTVTLTVKLGARMLLMGNRAKNLLEAEKKIRDSLKDGSALSLFAKTVEAQGGNPDICLNDKLPVAKYRIDIKCSQSGFVFAVDPVKVAMAAIETGAGRKIMEDSIDHSTGVKIYIKPGDEVRSGDTAMTLFHNNMGAEKATNWLFQSIKIKDTPPAERNIILL